MARRRGFARSLNGWGVFLGVVLALALVAIVVEIVRTFWWAFLGAGVILGVAWLVRRGPRTMPGRAAAPLPLTPAAPSTHPIQTPPSVPTLRGDHVRSRGEARIADFLHRRGIVYEYEPTISGFRPDFYVPEWNLIIEYWGINDLDYNRKRRVKSDSYRVNGFGLVNLEGKDWARLEEELMRKLYFFDKEIYRRPVVDAGQA